MTNNMSLPNISCVTTIISSDSIAWDLKEGIGSLCKDAWKLAF